MDVPKSLLNIHGNSAGNHYVLCVDCCSAIIAFSQYIQEASFEEAEMLAKAMTEYKNQCLANSTLSQCLKFPVSKLFAFLKQTILFVNPETFWLESLKREILCAPYFYFA